MLTSFIIHYVGWQAEKVFEAFAQAAGFVVGVLRAML
jgi:hypothetical protein